MIKRVVLKKEEEIFDNTNIYCLVNSQGEIFKLNYFYNNGYLFVSLRESVCSFGNIRKNINSLFYELKSPDSRWGKNKIYEFESEKQFSMWYYFIVNHQSNQIMKNTDYGEPKEINIENTIDINDVNEDETCLYTINVGKEIYIPCVVYSSFPDQPNKYHFSNLTGSKCLVKSFESYQDLFLKAIEKEYNIYRSDNIFEAMEFYKKQEDNKLKMEK